MKCVSQNNTLCVKTVTHSWFENKYFSKLLVKINISNMALDLLEVWNELVSDVDVAVCENWG